MWWHTSVIPACGRLVQGHSQLLSKLRLSCTVWDTVSKMKKKIRNDLWVFYLCVCVYIIQLGLPAHRMVLPVFRIVFPRQLNLSGDGLTDMPRTLSPRWFKCCQVDSCLRIVVAVMEQLDQEQPGEERVYSAYKQNYRQIPTRRTVAIPTGAPYSTISMVWWNLHKLLLVQYTL